MGSRSHSKRKRQDLRQPRTFVLEVSVPGQPPVTVAIVTPRTIGEFLAMCRLLKNHNLPLKKVFDVADEQEINPEIQDAIISGLSKKIRLIVELALQGCRAVEIRYTEGEAP